jgi:hypothetical protein
MQYTTHCIIHIRIPHFAFPISNFQGGPGRARGGPPLLFGVGCSPQWRRSAARHPKKTQALGLYTSIAQPLNRLQPSTALLGTRVRRGPRGLRAHTASAHPQLVQPCATDAPPSSFLEGLVAGLRSKWPADPLMPLYLSRFPEIVLQLPYHSICFLLSNTAKLLGRATPPCAPKNFFNHTPSLWITLERQCSSKKSSIRKRFAIE